MVKVAINGFGRIGRNILRALIENGRSDIEVIAINDLGPVETNAHLFRYDSVHGPFRGEVTTTEDSIDVGRGPIRVTAQRNPADLPWGDVDIVLECTGIFTSREACKAHLENGSSKVLISAPGKDVDRTVVYGVNHADLKASDLIVSNASCTTNCLAPVAKVLNDSFGIMSGYMTTIHAYTGDQPTLDRMHKDLYRARSAATSMIPTTTGAARAVSLVLPELEGKLDGSAIRVPTPNVSTVDLKVITEKPVTVETVNQAFTTAANGPLAGVLVVNDEPLVSIDINHNPASSFLALGQTAVQPGNLVRIMSWYDNEWGFSNRMLDTAAAMAAAGLQSGDATDHQSGRAA